VSMDGDSGADVALVPSLEPFRVEVDSSDISIRVEWAARLCPPSGRQLFDSGTTWELSEGPDGLQFDFNAAIFGDRPFKRLLIDQRFRRATLQMNEECIACLPRAVEPLGYPLDELLIMHRLTQEKAIELHGSGIVRPNGVGNLFVGHSGAGKSTTTRLWTSREEVEVLSDDRIIVRRDESSTRAVAGTPLEATGAGEGKGILRLRDCSASRGNHFAQDDRAEMDRLAHDDKAEVTRGGMRMYGTPWHGEAMFASPNSAPLTRIFVLEHGHGNVVTRLTKSQAVAELFARSFVPFHRHEYVESALEFLQELAEAVPCYGYSFEPDMGAVEKILNFCD
jgi:hypothetical protein